MAAVVRAVSPETMIEGTCMAPRAKKKTEMAMMATVRNTAAGIAARRLDTVELMELMSSRIESREAGMVNAFICIVIC